MYKMTTTRRDVGYDGLRRAPQMEEIVSYLANHQERMNFPDRQAKQIRNHPFMTQLDFFTPMRSKREPGRIKSGSRRPRRLPRRLVRQRPWR